MLRDENESLRKQLTDQTAAHETEIQQIKQQNNDLRMETAKRQDEMMEKF